MTGECNTNREKAEPQKLETPFGAIDIRIDGESSPYTAKKLPPIEVLCPDVRDRYLIVIRFQPDGLEHNISCVFSPICEYNRSPDSGEFMMCQAFYNDDRIKMDIGAFTDCVFIDDKVQSRVYDDFDVDYLDNGVSYVVLPHTRTNHYEFTIAWIDGVDWDEPDSESLSRDTQVWYAADPTIAC
ncbi:MAG: hypothetical protein IK083_06100 [Abditibacteriota bacterium]|nr:hypothetical protein [Abditibacteriota bacterium]